MSVSQFTLIPPQIKLGDLFQAMETVIPQQMISDAISESNSQEKRKRSLPTHVIIALISPYCIGERIRARKLLRSISMIFN